MARFEAESPPDSTQAPRRQFCDPRVTEFGERIPITIAGSNPEAGTITLVVQKVGKTTSDLCPGTRGVFERSVGPLGQPTHIERWGRVVCVAGGVGRRGHTADCAGGAVPPGIKWTPFLARSKDLLILEEELAAASERLHITTDDGSRGEKALVVAPLERILQAAGTSGSGGARCR